MHALAAACDESRIAALPVHETLARLQFTSGVATHLGTELRTSLGTARLTGQVLRGGSLDLFVAADPELCRQLGERAQVALTEGVRIAGTREQPVVLLD
jgi:hypothetical protein